MDAKKLEAQLRLLGACSEAREWSRGKSLQEAWDECERADWMLWLLTKMEYIHGWPDRKKIVLLACLCAETALKFVPAGEDRPRKAIETARAWCEGKATLKEVRAASFAASAASLAAASAASLAAASAASAASASFAFAASKKREALKEMAQLIRNALPIPKALAISRKAK